jgi:hypothetical protein
VSVDVGSFPQAVFSGDAVDGSLVSAVMYGPRLVLIDREVDGKVVWGQTFSIRPEDDEYPREIVEAILADPARFDRRPLWDVETGKAVKAIGDLESEFAR